MRENATVACVALKLGRKLVIATVVTACLFMTPGLSAKPNFVFFLVDDLGWGAMGACGSKVHETPHFDRLCQQGMRFTNGYSACTVCSPSRAAILTGQYPARLKLTDWIPGHRQPNPKLKIPDWSQEIDHSQVTLAEALQSHGYSTWFLGKWHLMPEYREWSKQHKLLMRKQHTPQKHGFDVNIGGREWGQPRGPGKYFAPFGMPGLESAPDGQYLTDRLTDEAIRLLDESGEEPFLLYMSYYTVHTPLMGKPADVEYFDKKLDRMGVDLGKYAADYAAMHRSLDESVGRVLKRIEELGKRDNTIVIFVGDNGGDEHYACGGLREMKGFAFEGGTRVPTCVSWPGVTDPGSVSHEPIIGMDFYPTMLEMAGLDPLPEQHKDGVSLAPVLRQEGRLDRDTLYWHYPHYHRTNPYSAVRHQGWKLIEFLEDGDLMLFDLDADTSEAHDLADSRPEKAQELLTMLRAWRAEVGAQMPTPNPDYQGD